jgi:WD40 repeat protein
MSLAWLPDGDLVTVTFAGRVARWNVSTGDRVASFGDPATQYLDVSPSPDGTTLALAGHDGVISTWDTVTGERLHTFVGHTAPCTGVAWSPDGKLLASSGDDGVIIVWVPSTAEQLYTIDAGSHGVMSVMWTPDGQHLVTAREDRGVEIWRATRDSRTLVELDALVAAHVPYRLVDGGIVGVAMP